MQYVVVSTEYTGTGYQDEVIQMAGLVCNEKLEVTHKFNFYCESVQVIRRTENCLDYETIHRFSKGLTFEDQFIQLQKELGNDVCWVCWEKRDLDIINQTLKKAGLPTYDFGKKSENWIEVKSKDTEPVYEQEQNLSQYLYRYYSKYLNTFRRNTNSSDAMYNALVTYQVFRRGHN